MPLYRIPTVSKEIKEVRVEQVSSNEFVPREGILLTIHDKSSDKESDKVMVHVGMGKSNNSSQSNSFHHVEKDDAGSQSGEEGSSRTVSVYRDLELATSRFLKENVLGEGGYGVVYRGNLINGTPVAVKKLLDNLGQAKKEFKVEVEAIGHVRHKNLVRLLGYYVEGTHRAVSTRNSSYNFSAFTDIM
ncbi:hypothetical protein IFM89_004089 [Coptis chinensis]|uniref:Protein kinase domain-containing protein n=1 Tax=Coptis chinensis TaxID=261450 RepID=A0A835ME37_9MAGN|nr:hypothetical protein IFM89_004089 [Coptis chinensis]